MEHNNSLDTTEFIGVPVLMKSLNECPCSIEIKAPVFVLDISAHALTSSSTKFSRSFTVNVEIREKTLVLPIFSRILRISGWKMMIIAGTPQFMMDVVIAAIVFNSR